MIPLAKMSDLSHDDWRRIRQRGLGGSDAAVLMGVNPYKDEFCVYVDKVCPELPDDVQRETAYWGQQLEPLVAAEFEKRNGRAVRSPEYFYQSSDHEFVVGSVDRFVWDTVEAFISNPEDPQGLLEIKTTSAYSKKYWASGPHDYARAQIQHYLLLTGLDDGYAACLIGGQQFVSYHVPRDEDYIKKLVKKEEDFWKRVQNQDPPTPDMMCADVPAAMARLARFEGREVTELVKPMARSPISREAKPRPETPEVEPAGKKAVYIGGVTFYR